MKRQVVAGVFGLALAGCALDRTDASKARRAIGPVGMTPPLSSIHEAINRENPKIDPGSVRAGHPPQVDPSAPRMAKSTAAADVKEEGTPSLALDATSTAATIATATAAPEVTPAPESTPTAEVPSGRVPIRLEPEFYGRPTEPAPSVAAEAPGPAAGPVLQAPPAAAPEVPASGPAPESPPAAVSRDPLLGTDPDIMPAIDAAPVAKDAPAPKPEASPSPLPSEKPLATSQPAPAAVVPTPEPESALSVSPAAPGTAEPSPAAAPEIPTTIPAAPGASATLPSAENTTPAATMVPSPAPAPSSMPDPAPLPGPAPAPISPAPQPDSIPAAPAEARSARDPLLGPEPDLMPSFELPKSAGAPKAETATPPKAQPTPAPEVSPAPKAETATPTLAQPAPTPDASPASSEAPSGPAEPPIVRMPGARPESPEDVSPAPSPSSATVIPMSVPTPASEWSGEAHTHSPSPSRAALPGGTPVVMNSRGGSKLIVIPRNAKPGGPVAADASVIRTDHQQPQPAVPNPVPVNPAELPVLQSMPEEPREPPTVPPPPPPSEKEMAPPDLLPEPIPLPPLGAPSSSMRDQGRAENVARLGRRPIVLGPGVVVRAASDPLTTATNSTTGVRPATLPSTPTPVPSDATSVRTPIITRSVFQAGKTVARVGDQVITVHELQRAVVIRRRGIPADQPLSSEQRYMLAKVVLNDLIDRTIIVQEAKHELKSAKNLKMFMDQADRVWKEEELPPLLRQHSVANIYELDRKLKERDESLDELRETFRQEFLSRGFMEQKIRPKLEVQLTEMRSYYIGHLSKFQRPAEVTWREVVVELSKSKTRAEARRRADDLLARLRRGEDFAKLAKAQSDGPNKSDGGLWKTSPGGYGVSAVNAALENLRIGEVSPLIEGPSSFHIVRVEAKRAAGPAEFAEVQDSIVREIRMEKARRESTLFLDRLRKRTIVSTVFDDPNVTRVSNETLISGPRQVPVRR